MYYKLQNWSATYESLIELFVCTYVFWVCKKCTDSCFKSVLLWCVRTCKSAKFHNSLDNCALCTRNSTIQSSLFWHGTGTCMCRQKHAATHHADANLQNSRIFSVPISLVQYWPSSSFFSSSLVFSSAPTPEGRARDNRGGRLRKSLSLTGFAQEGCLGLKVAFSAAFARFVNSENSKTKILPGNTQASDPAARYRVLGNRIKSCRPEKTNRISTVRAFFLAATHDHVLSYNTNR